MPYKSLAQMGYMHARHPKIAARWDKEHPHMQGLPRYAGKRKKKSALPRYRGNG